MPIKTLEQQIKDGRRDLPVIAFLAKGAPKPESGNKPGADLPYWRISAVEGYEAVEAAFLEVYGTLNQETGEIEPPAVLPIRLPVNPQDTLSYWLEERAGKDASLLLHRCDGVTQSVHYDTTLKTMTRKPIACASASREGCNCGHVAYLKVFLPDLIAATGIFGAVMLRTSSRVDVEHIVKFIAGLDSDLKGSGLTPNAPDLLLSRVPDSVSYEGTDGKTRSKEHYFVKLSYSPEWLKLHFDRLHKTTRVASDEPAAGEPQVDIDPRLEALVEELEKRAARYLNMSAYDLYEYHLKPGLNLTAATLGDWLKEWSYDATIIYPLIGEVIARQLLPVYIYGVRVERKIVNQPVAGGGTRQAPTYLLQYNAGFIKCEQFGREPFKEVFDEKTLDSWLFIPASLKYKDVPFDEPIPVLLAYDSKSKTYRVNEIAWDYLEGDNGTPQDLEPDEPAPIADATPSLPVPADETTRINAVMDLLEVADDLPATTRALSELSSAAVYIIAQEIGLNPQEYETRAHLVNALLIEAGFTPPAQAAQGSLGLEVDDSGYIKPNTKRQLLDMSVEQLKGVAKRENIRLGGARTKPDMIDVISEKLGL